MAHLWRRLVLPMLLALSGCAALQIDVDVYKGPLVNNEDIQKEQLLSMAMSAKPLLFGLRNHLLNEAAKDWDVKEISWRRRVLTATEFDKLIAAAPLRADVRNARQINEILRSYDDLGDSSLQPLLDDLRAAEVRHRRQLEDYAAGRRLEGATESDVSRRRYNDAWRSRVDIWAGMAALLKEADRLRGKAIKPEVLDTILRLAATELSDLTDPELLYCALEDSRARSGTMQTLSQRLRSSPSGVQKRTEFESTSAAFARARAAMTESLRTEPADSIQGLSLAHDVMRTTGLSCDSASPRATGIVRAPRKTKAEDDASVEFSELASKLALLDSSGFDSGRIRDGLDTLARRYAELRDEAVAADLRNERDAIAARERAARQYRRLEHALVDFASRMQFLATASWLINAGDSDSAALKRYKASLEVVGNSLVVHADDIRHRSQHHQKQLDAVGTERDAANAAFAPGAAVVLTNIERAVREQHAEDQRRAAATPGSQPSVSSLAAERQKRQDERTALGGALRGGADELRDLVALAVTLGLTKDVPDWRDLAKDTPAAWRADADALDRTLREPKDEASAEMLRKSTADWLTQALAGLSSPALRGSERAQRLTAAQRAIERFNPLATEPKVPRKSPLATLQKVAREQISEARRLDQQRRDATAELTREIQRLDTNIAAQQVRERAAQAGLDDTRFKAAHDEVVAVRASVLDRLDKAGTNVDFGLARGFMVLALQERAKAPDSKRAALEDAQALLQRLNPAQVLPAIAARPDGGLPVDVLDDLVARLNYRLLQEITTHGEDSPQAQFTRQAIAQARKNREEKLYLRSSTAYLRSVYAATSLQNDPGLDWSNMLHERFMRWYNNSDREGERDVRADLDKANWQNINTVSVGASGGSNFVLAKDDVGNWYVKAMGADPAAMVRAAKNLALYNIGGRFNSDLLRVDDLRERLDQENDPGKRAEMRTEIDELSARGGRSAGGASSETLKLFEKNHADQAQLQHEALAAPLAPTGLQQTLRQRWQLTLKGGNGSSALDSAFSADAVKAALDDAQRALDNKTTPVPAPKATREVLMALLRANTELKLLVAAAAELTRVERQALADADGVLTAKAAAVKASQQQVDEAAADLEKAQASLQSVKTDNDQAARDEAAVRFETARAKYAAAAVQHKDNSKALTEAEASHRDKTSALEAALARQLKAASDVDDVYRKFVEESAKRRLRAIEETESALRIIGSRSDSGNK